MSVVIETTLGDITVDLYLEQRPRTCLNFLKLCKVKYYNLCVFHKIERNFIAQSGDPSQTGRGGESIYCRLYGEQAKYFDAELKPRLKHEKLGTLSMVNNGNNMNGSQFFITLGENVTYLDEVHTVFGEVAEGFETLLKINEAICDPSDRPYQDIRITHTVILHDPYEDPSELEIPPSSPVPTKEQLQSNYIGADEEIDDTKGKSMEEIEEKIKDSEAKARATILEMVGDIPDAEVKPPENVLFVCKLNPVTTSEDLEVIFSRFGTIVSCEVIKDRKTGESLQYAFIEFENEEDCESAYFKMDNVLIDDRRIHVDFSQSVSKMNFENDGKFQCFQSQKRDNLVLKDKVKRQNDYNMIFDITGNDKEPPRESNTHKSFSPPHRHSSHNREKQIHDSKVKSSSYDRYSSSSYDRYSRKEYSHHSSKFIGDRTYKSSSKKVQETNLKYGEDKFHSSSHKSSRKSYSNYGKGKKDIKETRPRYSSSSSDSSGQPSPKKVKKMESRQSSYSERFIKRKSPERRIHVSESHSSKSVSSHSLKQKPLSQKKLGERRRHPSTSSDASSNSSYQSGKHSKHRSSTSQQTKSDRQNVGGKQRREEEESRPVKHKYCDSSSKSFPRLLKK